MIWRGAARRLGLRAPGRFATGGPVAATIVFNFAGSTDFGKQFMNLVRAGQVRLRGDS